MLVSQWKMAVLHFNLCHLQLTPAGAWGGCGAFHVGMPELGHRDSSVLVAFSITEILFVYLDNIILPDLSGAVALLVHVPVLTVTLWIPSF